MKNGNKTLFSTHKADWYQHEHTPILADYVHEETSSLFFATF